MSGRSVVVAAIAASLLMAAPALGQSQTDGKTVTATGTGQARVKPKDRHSNSSITAAFDAARKAAISSALSEAHEYALDYAKGVGLTLGSVLSVSDSQANGFYGPGGPGGFFGPFGPNKFCGTTRQVVGRPAPGTKPTFKKVHRCVVPPFAYTTLTVTYSAS
jgi:Protein of unknown function (DUF541)